MKLAVATLFSVATIAGCSSQGGDNPLCGEGKCDVAGEREDPIARYLQQAEKDGTLEIVKQNGQTFMVLEGDYETVLRGVAELQAKSSSNCGPDKLRTFVVSDDLVGGVPDPNDPSKTRPFPRIISTSCDGEPGADFFISAPGAVFEGDVPTGEIELQFIEMFAWDPKTERYQFYETGPAGDGKRMVVNTEPTRCQQCHLTPADFDPTGMRMTPIMNELRQPWTHWNAEPGFPSHNFDAELAKDSESWKRVVEPFLSPAADFERLVRSGQGRVEQVRTTALLDSPPEWTGAMNALRPVFCNEQVNYVSAVNGSVFRSAFIDPGVISPLQKEGGGMAWMDENSDSIKLPSGDPIDQIPVRGNADLVFEANLRSRRALLSEPLLRLRGYDWKRPAVSNTRCDMWLDAYEQFFTEPPDTSGDSKMRNAIRTVFNAVLDYNKVPAFQAGDRFLVVGDPENPDTRAAIDDAFLNGTFDALACDSEGNGACLVDAPGFAQMLGARLAAVSSNPDALASVIAERDERICHCIQQTSIETLPSRPDHALSGRFNVERDASRCAADCCSQDSNLDSCTADIVSAMERGCADDAVQECGLQCALPSRFANRPSLPEVDCEQPVFMCDGGVVEVDVDVLVLKLVNTATETVLDIDVGLDGRAAANIIDARPINSIPDLLMISFVKDAALAKLREFVQK